MDFSPVCPFVHEVMSNFHSIGIKIGMTKFGQTVCRIVNFRIQFAPGNMLEIVDMKRDSSDILAPDVLGKRMINKIAHRHRNNNNNNFFH